MACRDLAHRPDELRRYARQTMKALLGTRADGTIGLISSSRLDDVTDEDMLLSVKQFGRTGWKNMVVLDDEIQYPGQINCRLRRVETRIVG